MFWASVILSIFFMGWADGLRFPPQRQALTLATIFMGLDSVELLMEIEKYFGIQIPDAEAEKVYTIQNMVDSVATHLSISNDNTDLKCRTFQKIVESIPKSTLTNEQIKLTDNISKYISPDKKEAWSSFKSNLGLDVPNPDIIKTNSNKIKTLLSWAPNYDWATITVDQFVNAICAANYLTLVDKKNIKSKYEIYISVVGITVNRIGVEFYEIAPDKSFTNDLGVD